MGGSYSSTAVVGGHVSQGYETVREMFRRNVETGRERNAQLCVFVDGECVLDLWGSAEGDPDYTGDSLQCVFSTSKAVTAIAVAVAARWAATLRAPTPRAPASGRASGSWLP